MRIRELKGLQRTKNPVQKIGGSDVNASITLGDIPSTSSTR